MGMGFENCEVGFGIKMNWEMELVPPIPISTHLLQKSVNFYKETLQLEKYWVPGSKDTRVSATFVPCNPWPNSGYLTV